MAQCYASIEEPGLFCYECELPDGHDGQHVVHWDETRPASHPVTPASPGYQVYIRSLYERSKRL